MATRGVAVHHCAAIGDCSDCVYIGGVAKFGVCGLKILRKLWGFWDAGVYVVILSLVMMDVFVWGYGYP